MVVELFISPLTELKPLFWESLKSAESEEGKKKRRKKGERREKKEEELC